MSSAKDSAESHSEWRKVKEDIWNIHKKVKEISKEKAKKFQKKKHVGKKIAPRCAELLSIYSLIRVFTWRILASTHSQLLC